MKIFVFVALMAASVVYFLTGIAGTSLLFGAAAGLSAYYVYMVSIETDKDKKKQAIAMGIGAIILFSVLFYIVVLGNRTIVTDENRRMETYPYYIENNVAMFVAILSGSLTGIVSYLAMSISLPRKGNISLNYRLGNSGHSS